MCVSVMDVCVCVADVCVARHTSEKQVGSSL